MKEFWEKLRQLWAKTAPARSVIMEVLTTIVIAVRGAARWIYRLRSVLLSIPVVYMALRFAKENLDRLPREVGVNLLTNGEYQFMVSREVAVVGPLAVTAFCLLLMFCSRRVVYPWLISVFSLVLPLLIWVTNVFPA